MRNTQWIRIVLCGLVAGFAWHLLSVVPLAFLAPDLVALAEEGGPYPRFGGEIFLAIDLMMGIWAVWLYSAISSRYGARPRTASIVGVAWWLLKTLQSAKWVGIGLIPRAVILVPLVTTLAAALIASLVGAWIYNKSNQAADFGRGWAVNDGAGRS